MFNPTHTIWTKHEGPEGSYFRRGDALVCWNRKRGGWDAVAFGIMLRDFDSLDDAQTYLDAAPHACTAAQVVAVHYGR